MGAINVDLAFVKKQCPPGIYKSVWDRLVEQIFGAMPVGMNGELQIPNVDIWSNGVSLVSSEDPYSFTVMTDETYTPKPGDVVLYKGVYYIIGNVE